MQKNNFLRRIEKRRYFFLIQLIVSRNERPEVSRVTLCKVVLFGRFQMWIAEYICYSADSYESASCCDTRNKQIWHWYGHYAAGIATLTLVCEVMKILIGEPRPHFLDTCKPHEAVNCTDE